LTIRISNFAFSPALLTLSRGDTVEWVNQDSFIHTTAADSAAWSSPEIANGDHFLFVAGRAGRFPYHCAAHPVMRGEVVVQ
jgi:plastocyanin